MDYPVGSIDNWPSGLRSAFWVDQDTEHEFRNTENLIKVLKERDVPATFFCISSLAEKYPEVLKDLPPGIEIGSHLDSAKTLENQDYKTQLERIKRSKETLEKVSGSKVIGLKPAEEIYDDNTIKILMKLGFRYMIGNPSTPAAVPVVIDRDNIPKEVIKLEQLLHQPSGDFVIFPRIPRDDYYIMVYKKILDNDKILSILKADFQNIHNLGGLYIFAVHTQLFSKKSHLKVISGLLDYAEKYKVWMTNGRELYNWWSARNNLTHKIFFVSDNGFKAQIASKNDDKHIGNVGLTYYLPDSYQKVLLKQSESDRIDYSYDSKIGILRVNIKNISPRESLDIEVKKD
jgi:peptidoglycan/xylan/chitin deacetylase (PgdA/CDA1 family)